jgi:hypothetical protein
MGMCCIFILDKRKEVQHAPREHGEKVVREKGYLLKKYLTDLD